MSTEYRVFETFVFLEDLEGLDHSVRDKLEAKLRSYVYPQLRERPHFGPNIRKLRDSEPETWRYRIGHWRFFYEIDDRRRVVSMTTLDDRKDAY